MTGLEAALRTRICLSRNPAHPGNPENPVFALVNRLPCRPSSPRQTAAPERHAPVKNILLKKADLQFGFKCRAESAPNSGRLLRGTPSKCVAFVVPPRRPRSKRVAFVAPPGRPPSKRVAFVAPPGRPQSKRVAFAAPPGRPQSKRVAFAAPPGRPQSKRVAFAAPPGRPRSKRVAFVAPPGRPRSQRVASVAPHRVMRPDFGRRLLPVLLRVLC